MEIVRGRNRWGKLEHIERKTRRFKGTCTKMIPLRHMSFARLPHNLWSRKEWRTRLHQNIGQCKPFALHPSSWQLLHRSPSESCARSKPKAESRKEYGKAPRGRKPFHCAKWLFMMLLQAGSYQLPRLRPRPRPRPRPRASPKAKPKVNSWCCPKTLLVCHFVAALFVISLKSQLCTVYSS